MKYWKILICIFISFLSHIMIINAATPAPEAPECTTLPDGVEYWQRVNTDAQKSWFWQQIEALIHVIFGEPDKLPFGKSVAFLVGVGEYKSLPALPFVARDLEAMRTYLLGKGGFDEVYVAKDTVVTPVLIQKYMQDKFLGLNKESRLLFYYTGHGADFGGNTGYMQFGEALAGKWTVPTLAIDSYKEWSKMLKIKHILFIFDCCVSGLSLKKGTDDSTVQLADILSSNGSRKVMTAGTGTESSFGVHGQSVFTYSLLAALESDQLPNNGFLTIEQVYGELKSRVAGFCAANNRKMTPLMDDIPILSGDNYNGTFVFIDPGITNKNFTTKYKETLKIQSKGDLEIITIPRYGTLAVDVKTAGQLFLGEMLFQDVSPAATTEVKKLPAGEYGVTVRYADGYEESNKIWVEQDKTSRISCTYMPQPKSSSTPGPPPIPDYMVRVEGGAFQMGSSSEEEDEKPVHTVKVDTFYISKYEVTQEQYLEFCNQTKTNYPVWLEAGNEYNIQTGTDGYYKKFCGPGKESYPVVGISWYDAVAYCNWISRKQGLVPCYSGTGDQITCNFMKNGYRLPTEAEWEYAARGGNKTRGFEYSGSNYIRDVAWYIGNSVDTIHPVAQKNANELGLFDMSGNVWEWCWDRYGNYFAISQKNPRGVDKGTLRVLRGGYWGRDARNGRSACRGHFNPDDRSGIIGFRPVFVP